MVKSSKDKRDIFFRQSKSDGYRARSAYKLIHIDEEFQILTDSTLKVVDLCAAPGSWSQVLSRRLSENSLIVAVDLQSMAPIPGVIQLCGDITLPSTAISILAQFQQQKADLIVCDGAPEVTGMHDLDEFMQTSLLLSALVMATRLLKKGGIFITKLFSGNNISLPQEQFSLFFDKVILYKPPSSRDSSAEHFLICKGFGKWDSFQPEWLEMDHESIPNEFRQKVAFLKSGSFIC